MRIVGEIDEHNRGFVQSNFFSSKYDSELQVDFLVDTGAPMTMILDLDARKLGVDYDELNPAKPVSGISGDDVESRHLGFCELVFGTDRTFIVEKLDDVLVLRHKYTTPFEEAKAMELPSLLGMDILKNYKISFENRNIILDR